MKSLKVLLACLMALALLVGCGKEEEKGAEIEKIGGELVIYSPNSDFEIDNIIPAFEEAYGVTVHVQSMGTGECTAKLNAEKENPQADIMFGGVNLGVYTNNPDIFEEYTSPNDKNLDEAYQQDPNCRYFSNYLLSGSGALIVNKKLAEELGVTITGYASLLDERLTGKISSADPTASSSAWAELTNMLLVMGDEAYDEKAWEYVEKLLPILNGVQLQSSSAVYKGVASGEYVVGISYEDPCLSLVMATDELELVYPEEGTVWLPSASAVVKGAKNIDQAHAFIDFLQSDECQTILAGENSSVRGANSSIPSANPAKKDFSEINVAYEDIPFVASMKAEWQARYAAMFAAANSK
ncbi:MAG: extracellular solute-binding protein [Erysipelotrichaceae bacterium]|nr:extracellular solute-binding protein [Erysipelotrichaceae bacterium]